MRLDGWSDRLMEVIDRHSSEPYAAGKTDCFMLAMDTVEALIGDRLYPKVKYTNDKGAIKAMRKHGFDTLQEAMADKLELRPAGHWQRGDIAVLDAPTSTGDTLGIVFGSVVLCRQGDQMLQRPLNAAKAVFAVG